MKTFLTHALTFIVAGAVSAIGASAFLVHSINEVTQPVPLSRIIEAKKICEEASGMPCHLYGGYAPARPITAPVDPAI